MRQTIFINYANGVHRNNSEQQRRIVTNASRQKRTVKKATSPKLNRQADRDASVNQTNDVFPDNDDYNIQDGRILHDNDNDNYGPLAGQLAANPTSDNPLSGLDPFGALPIRTTMVGVHEILQYCMFQARYILTMTTW